jgi:4-hydroxy-3-polyprenylbenzoate decarboxylase
VRIISAVSFFGGFHSAFVIRHSSRPATIVGIPPMGDFYIGGASVKLFLPIFKMNFPAIVDIVLPAEASSTTSSS